jgi:hypothetical protein
VAGEKGKEERPGPLRAAVVLGGALGARPPPKRTLLDQATIRLGLGKVKHDKAGLALGQGLDHGLEDLGVGVVGRAVAALLDVPAVHVLPRRRARLFKREDNVLVRLLQFQGVVQRQQLVANVNAGLRVGERGQGGERVG